MYLELGLRAYTDDILDTVQELVNNDRGSVFQYLYCPDLEFRRVGLAKSELFSSLQSRAEDRFRVEQGKRSVVPWTVGGFTRTGLKSNSIFGTRLVMVSWTDGKGETHQFQVRWAEMDVDSVFFSNSISSLERYEEVFFTRYSSYTVIPFFVPLFNESFDVCFTDLGDMEFEKLETESYGTVSSFSFSQTMMFPVFSEPRYLRLYKRLIVEIGSGRSLPLDDIVYSRVLVSEVEPVS